MLFRFLIAVTVAYLTQARIVLGSFQMFQLSLVGGSVEKSS